MTGTNESHQTEFRFVVKVLTFVKLEDIQIITSLKHRSALVA